MLKRGHKGHVIDRNADIPTAGISTKCITEDALRKCMDIAHPEELAESLVRADRCGRGYAKASYLREGPFMPSGSVRDILTTELQKTRFASFKERFYEELFFKRADVGKIQPAHTKPDSVTNMSRTFGCPTSVDPNESLYSLIMPQKTPEQVNSEYQEFHEKRIISHNHYFPAEQINRKYTHPFDRINPCGETERLIDSGLMVKSCLTEGENHLKVIGKAQVDFMERTVAPLGKKFKKYLYEVPDITFGITHPSNDDGKMLMYNIVSETRTQLLMDAISHLNTIRLQIRKHDDIHLHHLRAIMEQRDPDKTGLLPIARVLDILLSHRIRLDPQKIRTVMSHYQLIVDEGLCSEQVKFRKFCKLLSMNEPMPSMGGVATYADADSLETTYRLFCADLLKRPNAATGWREHQVDKDNADKDTGGVKELLSPEIELLGGLQASDFTQLRPKEEIEQVFRNIIAKDEFEAKWQSLMDKDQDQDGLVSVRQFYNEIKLAKLNLKGIEELPNKV
ncbi:hypothetical protein KR054_000840 [Drosophila jambulina]|nr:hypothetical protein KR054_000840 [Drosophila jambulina]